MRSDIGSRLVELDYDNGLIDRKQFVPTVEDLDKARGGGIIGMPELADFTQLTPEESLQSSNEPILDQYYNAGKKLNEWAIQFRKAGIDVTKPDPTNDQALEASKLWNAEYMDWLKQGEQLKAGREVEKKAAEYLGNANMEGALPQDMERAFNYQDLGQNYVNVTGHKQLADAYDSARKYGDPASLGINQVDTDQALAKIQADIDRYSAMGMTQVAKRLELEKARILNPTLDQAAIAKDAWEREKWKKQHGLDWTREKRLAETAKKTDGPNEEDKERDFLKWHADITSNDPERVKRAGGFVYNVGTADGSNIAKITPAENKEILGPFGYQGPQDRAAIVSDSLLGIEPPPQFAIDVPTTAITVTKGMSKGEPVVTTKEIPDFSSLPIHQLRQYYNGGVKNAGNKLYGEEVAPLPQSNNNGGVNTAADYINKF